MVPGQTWPNAHFSATCELRIIFFPPELRTEPRALRLLGKCSTTEPNLQALSLSTEILLEIALQNTNLTRDI